MHTPRSPSSSGSLPSIAAAASRSTLNVPIRFTLMTVWNGSKLCGPRLPAVLSAQPMPAQQTEIRSSPGGLDRGLHLLGVGDVARHEPRAQLAGERLALLGVQVRDRHLARRRPQPPRGRRAEPGRAARDERARSLDSHGRGPYRRNSSDPAARPQQLQLDSAPGAAPPAMILGSASSPLSSGERVRTARRPARRRAARRQRRAALAQQRAHAPRAQVGEHRGRRRIVEAHHLDRRRHVGRRARRPRVDQHRLLGRREQPGLPRDVEAAGDEHRGWVLGQARGDPPRPPLLAAHEPRVALGAQRAGADQHRVGRARAARAAVLEVGVVAERGGAAVDRRAAVERPDHVHVHERPVRGRARGAPPQ